jgi:hypothetical protein
MIGKKILTRSLNNEFEPEDITEHYKTSNQSFNHRDHRVKSMSNDVTIQLTMPNPIPVRCRQSTNICYRIENRIVRFQFGDEIVLELDATNKADDIRTLTTALTVCVMTTAGQQLIAGHDQSTENFRLDAGKSRTRALFNESNKI